MREAEYRLYSNEAARRKIDIIPWSEGCIYLATLSRLRLQKLNLDEEIKKVEVIVPDDQLSLAIGRRGQNI